MNYPCKVFVEFTRELYETWNTSGCALIIELVSRFLLRKQAQQYTKKNFLCTTNQMRPQKQSITEKKVL